MKYTANFRVADRPERKDAQISIDKEGLTLGGAFVDYADIEKLRPISHRVFIDMAGGYTIEISMLGFSYDGFWEELVNAFGKRSLDSLFLEEPLSMDCEGEYELPAGDGRAPERGRGHILLYPDSVCILPDSSHAVRIPLCFTQAFEQKGYWLQLSLVTGETYGLGRMGYDTQPFMDRCEAFLRKAKKDRVAKIKAIAQNPPEARSSGSDEGEAAAAAPRQFPETSGHKDGGALPSPFTHCGIFRTYADEGCWMAAFGSSRCAVELFTGEQAATYLYHYQDRQAFLFRLEMAMEAVGTHREIIFLGDEQLADKPLYRMALHRSPAVRFLRSCSAGRIIHTAAHAQKLAEFLASDT